MFNQPITVQGCVIAAVCTKCFRKLVHITRARNRPQMRESCLFLRIIY